MKTVIQTLRRRATKQNVFIVAILWAALAFGVMPMAEAEIKRSSEGTAKILDLSFGYSAAEAYTNFTNLGAAGRQMYLLAEGTADVVYPLVTALFFALLLARLQFLTQSDRFPKLPLLPFLTLAADYLENLGLMTALLSFPVELPFVVSIASVLTQLKWLFAVATVVAVLVLVGRFVFSNSKKMMKYE